MAFILRWPAILVLLALALLSLLGAAAAGAALGNVNVPFAEVQNVQSSAVEAGAGQQTWLDVGLWAAAGIFFFVAMVRLIRRTQGFWAWLLGFACYGGRWAWSQQQNDGGVAATIQSVDWNTYREPQVLLSDFTTTEAQLALLGVILVVGLFAFIVDAVDRAYWDSQGA
ncbi:hypothetical protein [Terricaulis sp.]|uniref:hypothetical protein n=1 Tax=Terricaulis sp. TaxID=2768686 RepID=UPI0037842123